MSDEEEACPNCGDNPCDEELDCGTCDSPHCSGTPCPMVSCIDCGCEHYGTDDKCYCGTGYCEECECEPEAEEEEEWYGGCACCFMHYQDTNTVDSCSYGDDSVANEECAYYATWALAQTGPTPKHKHFSVRHLESRHPHDVDANNEVAVAMQLGLDPHMDLSQACADFYILERLYYNSHDLASRYDGGQHRYVPSLPMDFGKGTQAERLAYAIASTRESLNKELAKQLLTYMVMAVGGELRHAPGQAHHIKRTRSTPKSKWPKSKERYPWKSFYPYWAAYKDNKKEQRATRVQQYGCAACLAYVRSVKRYSGDKAAWKSIYPCNRARYVIDSKTGKEVLRAEPATQANRHCGYFDWWAAKHKVKVGKEIHIQYQPHNPRMREFFKTSIHNGDGRGLAWREWLKMYSQYGPALLADCERVFMKWYWGSSYGGKKWGEATHFAFEFAAGRMSAPAFLDRVWTLEHNGGNLFNKFYRKGTNNLPVVLEQQSTDAQHYPKLIKHASSYTQELYRDSERLGILKRTPEIVWG